MDKFRKILEQVWFNKERTVLGILLIVLGWYVYKATNPPPPPPPKVYQTPKPTVDEMPEGPQMPQPPSVQEPKDWSSLWKRNPLWYFSTTPDVSNKEITSADAGISLVRVMGMGDRSKAQIRTVSSTKWYTEGAKFESFELLSIDPATKSCVVRSERYGKNLTLTAP